MRDRWSALCRRLGDTKDAEVWWCILEALHATPPRAYHNLDHVAECLQILDGVRDHVGHPDRVEFALWFHDCVYVPGRSDNESKSAEIASLCARSQGRPQDWAAATADLIMITRHTTAPGAGDEAWIADIDMSVLATPAPRYDRYAAAIRAEYAFVPDDQFRAGRAAFLRGLLQRPTIFHTPTIRASSEAAARANLAAELARLESKP